MIHTIIKDGAIGIAVIVAVVVVLFLFGVFEIDKAQADGNNPFE